ncbi:MAG: hypothetical protein KF753_05995 [Caldilineaceae bacterium]|nr:hypothetical protein [Caldilineaceae bacterium]
MTKSPISESHPPYPRSLWLPILLCAIGVGLRLLRLEWQPLWWDEGYSVYFATEPLAEMVRLTALDIHPPLYYALLHLWLIGFGSASPLILRGFSVLVGVLALPAFWWLVRLVYPSRPRVALWGLLLLALNPMHIFYSQEVRMYGLEMLLGIVSTGYFWQLTKGERQPGKTRAWVGYVAATAALLYTEYYAVLLPLGHGLWSLWYFRRQLRRLLPLVVAWLAAALAFLPWLLYAVPALVPYVSQKIVEDADRPLGLFAYGLRHLVAFTSGHIRPVLWLAPVAALLLLVVLIWLFRARQEMSPSLWKESQSPTPFFLTLLLLPFAAGFVLNLRLPFFPEGGERVLLFVLPYFLLLLAAGLEDVAALRARWGRPAAAFLLLSLLVGTAWGGWNFYTVPRYLADDYRPLIQQTEQQGSDTDTVLAVFPWQVGYWRAYAPVWGRGELHGPWPLLTPSPAWGADVQQAIDDALGRGKLWFPAHLSLGGVLEGGIEDYLRGRVSSPAGQVIVNFENRWYSPTTRLSGWAEAADPVLTSGGGDFAVVRLERAGVGAKTVASANAVVALTLDWSRLRAEELQVTLRLVDGAKRVWAQRDYAPLGSWTPAGPGPADWDRVGLLVPAGLPPGEYWLGVGVGPVEEEWLYRPVGLEGGTELVGIGSLQVRRPSPLPSLRLPIQNRLPVPVDRDGIDFLGSSGFNPAVATLAGAQINLSLFVAGQSDRTMPWEVYASVLDKDGNGVAGWEGWPLSNYPSHSWQAGTQLRLPLSFYLPATLSPGSYRLVAGLSDPASGQKSIPVDLGQLPIVRRAASFAAPQPQHPLELPALFGSHASLLGYDIASGTGVTSTLTLYWRVEQTLLPSHNVFVHLRDDTGTLLSQDDGVPGRRQTAAPSNTWIPGEIVSDPHTLTIPAEGLPGVTVQVGLYEPSSGVRLPVSVNGQVVGDSYSIHLDIP